MGGGEYFLRGQLGECKRGAQLPMVTFPPGGMGGGGTFVRIPFQSNCRIRRTTGLGHIRTVRIHVQSCGVRWSDGRGVGQCGGQKKAKRESTANFRLIFVGKEKKEKSGPCKPHTENVFITVVQ